MRYGILGCRKFASFSAVLSLIPGLTACSESSASPPLYSVVDGSWATACIPRQDLFTSYRIDLRLENAQDVTRRETYFADAHCDESLAFLEYQGTYELIVTNRDFIYAVDLNYSGQALEPMNAEGQARLEAAAFCGRQDWPLAEAQYPLSFDPGNCTAVGPVPLKNLNLLRVSRGFSLEFGADLAHENERPVEIVTAPQLVFLSQPLP
ncbi:MAG TPA: hypothetical protein VFO10_26590 [Oligoflexus sp.]|uniref:hypothetical protein n=1 Tax=Oligoflexus sp. TaxID=1971216 RepID=UPI002D7FA562|nr:hypothetical protein [Oligoflexus sp.]HET9240861.1 hypothetical protein [Oligoflexus sp.]